MAVYVFAARRMKLNNAIFIVPKQGFDVAHFAPRRAAILCRYRNMLPSSAVARNCKHRRALRPDAGLDEERTVIAVGLVARLPAGANPQIVWNVERHGNTRANVTMSSQSASHSTAQQADSVAIAAHKHTTSGESGNFISAPFRHRYQPPATHHDFHVPPVQLAVQRVYQNRGTGDDHRDIRARNHSHGRTMDKTWCSAQYSGFRNAAAVSDREKTAQIEAIVTTSVAPIGHANIVSE